MRILSFDLRSLDIQVNKLHFTGGERQFFELTKRWIDLGNEVHTIGSEYTYYLANIFKSRMLMHIYNPLTPPPKRLIDFVNIKRMMKKIPRKHFDLIYCPYELFEWVFASVFLKNKLKIPLVTSVNLLEPHEISTFPLFMLHYKRYFRNLFLGKSDLILCVSSYIKDLLVKLGIDKERIYSVGSGINLEAIESIGPQEKIYDACFLGDIIPRKGISDLVISWKAVTNENPNRKLVIIGTGSEAYSRKIERLIKELNLQNNIIMPGFVTGEEKYKLLKKSRIFIFPSYSESFSIAVCEAMACGLPVIAYNLPAYKEHYGNDIMYVKKRDIKDLVSTTLTLLKNDDLQRRMMLRGIKRARQYSWEKIAKYELELITQKLF